MAKTKVLVLDDEQGVRFGIREFLASKGCEVVEADTCQRAQEMFRAARPDVAIFDYSLSDGNALDLLPRIKAIDPSVPVILLTAHGTIDLAVRAIKEGVDQFLTKPVELPALHLLLERVQENRRNRQKQVAGKCRRTRDSIDPFRGISPLIRQLGEQARKVLAAESPILIHGETGTGKGILARWLHENGPRAEEPFVDLNCAGLSREFLETELFGHEKGAFTGAVNSKVGLLEVAHRGSVFLDEIGDMDLLVQPKLLKALEEKQFRRLGDVHDRQVDVRLIAATHQDLGVLVREKKFRSDLYFRISTIHLTVPPLRDRVEDIQSISERLLEGFARVFGRTEIILSPEALGVLRSYPWPGNIRELRNVLERAVLRADGNTLGRNEVDFHNSSRATSSDDFGDLTLLEAERRHIQRVLQDEQGRVDRAAKRLGIPRSSLYNKIKKHQIVISREYSPS
jgi:DNA-binding NtrC family response regulator